MAMSFSRMFEFRALLYQRVFVCKKCFASSPESRKRKEHLRVNYLFEKHDPKASKEISGKKMNLTTSYRDMLDERHDEAARSVLIRINQHPQDVCDSLHSVGSVKAAYSLQRNKNYLLIEFTHTEAVDKLLKQASYFANAEQIPVRSRLLYHMQFDNARRSKQAKSVRAEVVQAKEAKELTAEDCLNSDNVSSQMIDLHNVRQLPDVGYRLRFLICSMVEDLVRTCLPFCRIDPFGSSSNGFGWDGCDLDMMMTLKAPLTKCSSNSKFVFLTKRSSEDDRIYGQQCLDIVGEMVRVFMPSAYNVDKVLNARVPIVKFHHEAAEIDCDLSYTNLSGAKMSELMYLLGEADYRVRILMTTVKHWAKACDVTHSYPGPWPANFTLLAMLVFFLQSRKPPVLPSLHHLQELAEPSDHFVIDGVDYAFVTDVKKIGKSANTETLDELLKEFFFFYGHFDFATYGLSLIEGRTFTKTSQSPMYIENPLDICHNVSKNVNITFVTRLQETMLEALRCLESHSSPNRNKPWGLPCLFQSPGLSRPSVSYSVAGLFVEDQSNSRDPQLVGEEDDVTEERERRNNSLPGQKKIPSLRAEADDHKSTSEKGSAACS